MSRQIISMGVRVGSVFRREYGFFHGLMCRMGKRMIQGMMARIFQVPFTVHAGP